MAKRDWSQLHENPVHLVHQCSCPLTPLANVGRPVKVVSKTVPHSGPGVSMVIQMCEVSHTSADGDFKVKPPRLRRSEMEKP